MKRVRHTATGQVYGWNRAMAASGDFEEFEEDEPALPQETISDEPPPNVEEINEDLGQLNELYNT